MIPAALKEAATHVIGARGKKLIKYGMLRTRTALGVEPFTSSQGWDKIALAHLPRHGFFVEAGANDGFTESNTYYLEQRLGWRGLLIEPVPQLAAFARRIRSSPVICAALGSPEDEGKTITLNFSDTVSRIGDADHVKWGGMLGKNPKQVSAQLRTLSSILHEAGNPHVDYLSLDVEEYELEALSGLDHLSQHAPGIIQIETSRPQAVKEALQSHYELFFSSGGEHFFRLNT